MKHAIAVIIFFIIFLSSAHSQTLSELQKEREKTEASIALTNKLLKETNKNKNQELSNIKLLSSKISYRKKLISNIHKETAEMNRLIASKETLIKDNTQKLSDMKQEYAKLIQHMWTHRSHYDRWMYVLAGEDIAQIYRRFRYLNEFTKYQESQAKSIQELTAELSIEKNNLATQKKERIGLITVYSEESNKLKTEQETKSSFINSLDSKEKKLLKELKAQQKRNKELEQFVNKLITKESNKTKKDASGKMALTPNQKITSSQFADNKGKLPWPVANGVLDESYGTHAHEVYKRVKIENIGIEIRTDKGSKARSVFNGEVTSVMALPGFNKGVIIRHGEYLTLYANLTEVYVKVGDQVKTKQDIGKIFTDKNGKTSVAFQVYKEKIKQNPQLWLSK